MTKERDIKEEETMKILVLLGIGLLLSGCVNCTSTDPDTGDLICTTYDTLDACPDGETEVESCP